MLLLPPNVKRKIDVTIQAEGGDKFTENPNDKGGATKFGITQNTYNAFGYIGTVAACTYDEAATIYSKQYWYNPGFDKIAAIHDGIASELFDWGVTSGPVTATKALQRALNVLNRQGKDFPDLTVDGNLGPLTVHALKGFAGLRGSDGLDYLLGMIEALRAVYYIQIAEKDASQEEFVNGWIDRVFKKDK